jgi:hypothetical protein
MNIDKTQERDKITYLWVCPFDCYKLKWKFVIIDPQQHLNIHP